MAGAAGADAGPPVITAGVTGTPSPPVGVAAAPGATEGVSTGTCAAVNDSPPLKAGAEIAGDVANAGGACGSAAEPGSIACIAPSDNDCRPAVAGCPVVIPVKTDCPIGPGEKPCPRAAGERGAPGVAEIAGAVGPPTPGTDGLPAGIAAGDPAGTGPPLANAPALSGAGDDCAPTPGTFSAPPPPAPPLASAPELSGDGNGACAPPPGTFSEPAPAPAAPRPRGLRGAVFRSSSVIWCGGGTSSALKPCSRAQSLASPWIPSASRIFCVAAMILLTAAADALAASALHLAWIAWISANCRGSGFFDARTSSISLLPSFAISVSRLRR